MTAPIIHQRFTGDYIVGEKLASPGLSFFSVPDLEKTLVFEIADGKLVPVEAADAYPAIGLNDYVGKRNNTEAFG